MTGAASILGFVAGGSATVGILTQADSIDGWGKILAGGSAAALISFLFVWVLKHYTAAQEKANTTFADAIKDGHAKLAAANEKFAQAIADHGARCDKTTTDLLREARASHEAREKMLIETLKEFGRQ